MAMRSCRVTWTIWLAFFGGAVIGLGFADGRCGVADEWGMDCMPGIYAEEEMGLPPGPCDAPMDELSPAPLADVEPMDATDHFDTGPVWDDETDATLDAVASDEASQDCDGYRYEYPEDPCELYDEGTDDADYAEEYYDKYDHDYEYEYAGSEDEWATEDELAEEAASVDEHSYESECDYGMEYDYEAGYEDESESEAYAWDEDDYESTCDETEYDYAWEDADADDAEDAEDDYSYEYGEWESDYSYDDSDYRYDYETETADEQETLEGREWESDYADYGCDYEDEYTEEEYYYEYASDEFEPTEEVETAVEEATESGYTYDYDEWECEYDSYEYGPESQYVNDNFETFDADDTLDETETDASESAYDQGEWEYEYGEYDYGCESEYVEDRFETFDAVEDTMDDTTVDEATDWEYEYGEYEYDEYQYDEYEYDYTADDALDETAVDEATDWEYEYDEYEYDEYDYTGDGVMDETEVDDDADWEYEYGDYEYDEYDYDYASDDAVEETEVDAWKSEYDYDVWVSEYGEYYEEERLEDDVETLDAVEDTVEQAEVEEADTWESACDYDVWDSGEYGYGHTADCYDNDSYCTDDDAEVASDDSTDGYAGYTEAYPEEEYAYPEIVEETQESDVDEFSYYHDLGDEYESEAECDLETDYASEYGYDAEYGGETEYDVESEYSYDDGSEYGWECETALDASTESASDEAADCIEEQPYRYDYADPYEYYGYDYSGQPSEGADESVETSEDEYCEWMEADEPCVWESESATESGLELFAWHPTELLLTPDQEVLKTLETLCGEPSGVRRATLNDYLEALGWEAIALASRFEDVTGIEVLGLADDVPGAAAFLGTFRLLEQGELGTDEAVDLLRRSLQNLSFDWIEGVREITADAFEDWEPLPTASEADVPEWSGSASAGRPVMEVMVSLAARSLASMGGALYSMSQGLSQLDLERLAAAATEDSAQR